MRTTEQLLPTVQGDIMAFAMAVPAAVTSAGTESGKTFTGGFTDGMSTTFANAFAGGGGFLGGLQATMTQGWGKLFLAEGEEQAGGFLGSMQEKFTALGGIPLVGPLLAAFGPALISGIGKLASKVWGGIKALFGGPDEMEKAGREAAADARDAIASTLTDGQIKEAAGNMADAVHIAVRDATLGAGGTIEMAERTATEMVKLLHAAEKDGVGAVDGGAAGHRGDPERDPENHHDRAHDRAPRRVREFRVVIVGRVPAVADRSESCEPIAARDQRGRRRAEGCGDRRDAHRTRPGVRHSTVPRRIGTRLPYGAYQPSRRA